jgi:hypothetical protein
MLLLRLSDLCPFPEKPKSRIIPLTRRFFLLT